MPSITICSFLTLTNSFKLFDQNLALTALYYFEGMNDTEIAELFNTSRSTIQYRRTSSFEKLRKYLEENADEWDEW